MNHPHYPGAVGRRDEGKRRSGTADFGHRREGETPIGLSGLYKKTRAYYKDCPGLFYYLIFIAIWSFWMSVFLL